MISSADFKEATDFAHADSMEFSRHILHDEVCFDPETWNPNIKRNKEVLAFYKFAALYDCPVFQLGSLPQSGYCSWLFRTSDKGFSIGICYSQMVDWLIEDAMPVPTQTIRAILHELGHKRVSLIATGEANKSDIGPITNVPKEEEEKAWVYAVTFLGIMLGDYAKARKDAEGFDDSPKVFL